MDSLPATCFTPCHVSRRVIYTSCPKYQKSVGFFSCCLCVGKCRSKPGKVSFDFGRTHKCKKIESALHWVWTTIFGRNRAVYLGWEAKMSTTSEWNYRRIFIICKVEFCQGTNSEPQPLPLMPRCLYLITNTHFGFVFISHWYYRRAMAEHLLRGRTASCSLTDTITLSSQAHWSQGHCGRGRRVATTHFKPTIFHHWVSALFWRDQGGTVVWFPLVICQIWPCL